jgi:hypothetical protein
MTSRAAISLTTGLEDPEKVTVAMLVALGAVEGGRATLMFLTKEAVRLVLPGYAIGVACDGCPTLPSCSARSASTRASSTPPRWPPTPSSAARCSCGSGSETSRSSRSATEEQETRGAPGIRSLVTGFPLRVLVLRWQFAERVTCDALPTW